MKTAYILTSILGITILISGCNKYLDVGPPEDQLSSSVVFEDDKTAIAATVGLYSSMNAFNSAFANYMVNFMPSMSADEFYYSFSSSTFDEFKNNNLTASNSYVSRFWDPVYSYIYQTNALTEGLEKSTKLSPALKQQLLGEAAFLRAFYYFNLANTFGDVPLILDTDYKVNTSKPRTNIDSVYASILKDLLFAQESLSNDYPSAERVRANKAAATALLSRVYLYRNEFARAEEEATKIITNTNYSLLSDLNLVFLKNSKEAILQWQSVNKSTPGVNTWEGFSVVPAAAGGRALYNLTSSLVNSFEPNDKRKTNWTNTYTLSGTTYYYPYKYKIRTKSTVDEYSMVIRLAELYLIRAEARAQQNGKISQAISDINAIRSRAGLIPVGEGETKESCLEIIAGERWRELFVEAAHRWFDLKRTNKALTTLPVTKDVTIDANDLLYPIPTSALLTNPNLKQNPGYN